MTMLDYETKNVEKDEIVRILTEETGAKKDKKEALKRENLKDRIKRKFKSKVQSLKQ